MAFYDTSPKQVPVSRVVFETMHIELVRYIKDQYPITPYLDAGMDQSSAETLVNSLVQEKVMAIGTHVGRRLAIKLADLNTMPFIHIGESPQVKFVAKEVWIYLFGKPADLLQTDYRGTFVLHDHDFRWIQRFSATPQTLDNYIRPYTWLACGIIQGALFSLGLNVDVKEVIEMRSEKTTIQFRITDLSSHNHDDVPTKV